MIFLENNIKHNYHQLEKRHRYCHHLKMVTLGFFCIPNTEYINTWLYGNILICKHAGSIFRRFIFDQTPFSQSKWQFSVQCILLPTMPFGLEMQYSLFKDNPFRNISTFSIRHSVSKDNLFRNMYIL